MRIILSSILFFAPLAWGMGFNHGAGISAEVAYPSSVIDRVAHASMELQPFMPYETFDPEVRLYPTPGSEFVGVNGRYANFTIKGEAIYIGVPLRPLGSEEFKAKLIDFAMRELLAFRQFRDNAIYLQRHGVELVLHTTIANTQTSMLTLLDEVHKNPGIRHKIAVIFNERGDGEHQRPKWINGLWSISADIDPDHPNDHVVRLDNEFLQAPFDCVEAMNPLLRIDHDKPH